MSIEKFINRVSVRDFDGNPIDKKDIETITNVINNAPTSTNTQQFSAIIIQDKETLDWIAKSNWGQMHLKDGAFILFVADRTRVLEIANQNNITQSDLSVKHDYMRAVVDATIGATYAHDALMDMGYGTCFIGGPLSYADELHKKLDLPESTMIVVGLSFGKATKLNDVKPKMNKVFFEKYDKEAALKDLEEANNSTIDYYAKRNQVPYKEQIVKHISKGMYDEAFSVAGKYIDQKYKDFK